MQTNCKITDNLQQQKFNLVKIIEIQGLSKVLIVKYLLFQDIQGKNMKFQDFPIVHLLKF